MLKITIEGERASGKTTVAVLLKQFLSSLGFKVEVDDRDFTEEMYNEVVNDPRYADATSRKSTVHIRTEQTIVPRY